jgi:hypothetical protein
MVYGSLTSIISVRNLSITVSWYFVGIHSIRICSFRHWQRLNDEFLSSDITEIADWVNIDMTKRSQTSLSKLICLFDSRLICDEHRRWLYWSSWRENAYLSDFRFVLYVWNETIDPMRMNRSDQNCKHPSSIIFTFVQYVLEWLWSNRHSCSFEIQIANSLQRWHFHVGRNR